MKEEVHYSQELADQICSDLADGMSLRSVCRQDGMPTRKSVFAWLRTNDEFLQQYQMAKAEAADAMVDDLQEISDNMSIDHNHKRIMVDTRKWIASKLKAKKYGDKVAVTGEEDGAPIVVRWLQPGEK